MTARRTALALGACLLAAGLAGGCKDVRRVPTATHEDPRTSLFPHAQHADVPCLECHADVEKEERLGAAKLPGPAKCEECHPDLLKPTDETTRKAAAAAAALARPRPTDYQITFDHASHLGLMGEKDANAACARCHPAGQLPGPRDARSPSPPMQTCTACHQHAQDVAEARCSPCHVSLRRYPLKPIQALAGLSHTVEFNRRGHGRIASSSPASCAQCHDQTYCATCHANATVPFRPETQLPELVERDFIHRGDYVSRHQIEASADPSSCRRCHGSFFCDSCHREQRLSQRNALGSGRARNPHPPGWASPASGEFHGRAARQNIITCAGCHDQQGAANLCVSCHRSLGPGIPGSAGRSPHPPGYGSTHGRDEIRKNGMCVACHTNG